MVRRLDTTPPPSLALLKSPKLLRASVMPLPKKILKKAVLDLHLRLRPSKPDALTTLMDVYAVIGGHRRSLT